MNIKQGQLFQKKRVHTPSEYTPDIGEFEWFVKWDEPDRGLLNLSLPLHPKDDFFKGAGFKEGDVVKFKQTYYADIHQSFDCAELYETENTISMPLTEKVKEKMTETLERLEVYLEKSYNGEWCYKYSFPGQDTVIVSHAEKEKAANKFFVEYLKSLHYSIRYLFEEKRFDQLNRLIDKMQSYKEPNIDKTIEILLRSGIAEALTKYKNQKQ